jgi:hypothetical protein
LFRILFRSLFRFSFRFVVLGSLFVVLAATGCTRAPAERVSGVYAHDSRALLRLDYDFDGDGRIDVRTYMRDGRPVRLEADANADGLIDRWEYYGSTGALLRIGGSTQDDGREDTWVRMEGDRRFVDIASARDGRIDRREVYEGETLVRAESDTNRDGLPDRWEEFGQRGLVRLMLDDEKRHGRPTRRILYETPDAARVETDVDGDGAWEADDVR